MSIICHVFHVLQKGRHYSVDWTTGLDYWTGLLDWTTGLDYWTGLLDSRNFDCLWGEKGTPMCRAKTPGHKVCSSVVVTHLKVASSSVPSYSALFCCCCCCCCCIWTGTWAWLHLDPALTSVHGHYSCVMQCSRVAGCSSFVLTAVLFFHVAFFRDERRMWNSLLVANCNPFPFRTLSLERKAWVRGFTL